MQNGDLFQLSSRIQCGVARAIEKHYYAFQKTLAALPFEWHTQFLGEPWNDASCATTTTWSATTVAPPPLGFHGRLAASSCAIRVLEDACRFFSRIPWSCRPCPNTATRRTYTFILLQLSMLHIASTTTSTVPTATPSAILLPSPSSNKSTAVASNYHGFLETFLAHQSATTNETLHQHSSYAGSNTPLDSSVVLVTLRHDRSPSDPVLALIAPHGTIPDPQLALVALAPHVCLAYASKKSRG